MEWRRMRGGAVEREEVGFAENMDRFRSKKDLLRNKRDLLRAAVPLRYRCVGEWCQVGSCRRRICREAVESASAARLWKFPALMKVPN